MKSRNLSENEIKHVAVFLTKEFYEMSNEQKNNIGEIFKLFDTSGDFDVDKYINAITDNKKMGSNESLDYINKQINFIKQSISFAVDTPFGTYISITNIEKQNAIVDEKLENTLFLGEGIQANVLVKSIIEILLDDNGNGKLLNYNDVIGVFDVGNKATIFFDNES